MLLLLGGLVILFYIYQYQHMRMRRILPFLSKNDRILDLGCGDCCTTLQLQKTGYNVTGLDVIDKGKCLHPQLYDGKKIPSSDKSFDVVICSFILHHIPNQIDLLREIARVTKKYIIIFEDTPENQLDYFFTRLHAKSDWGQCTTCFKTCSQWLKIFKEHSLSIQSIDRISRFEFPFSNQPYFYPVPTTFFVVSV